MKLAQRMYLFWVRLRLKILSWFSKPAAARAAFDIFCTPLRRSRKEITPGFAAPRDLEFSQEGIPIRGYQWNAGQKRKALLLHGFESTLANFEHFVVPLINLGYEVLAFDARAHGRSGGKRILLPEYTASIGEIDRLFGPVDAFIAHSFGGLALALYLENLPEASCRRAVLLAPLTETPSAIDHFFSLLNLDPSTRTEFDKLITTRGGHPPSWYSLARAAENIHSRVLWIHDEDDRIAEFADAERVRQARHPQISWHITRGLGHRRIYREPAVVEKILEFLGGKEGVIGKR